MLILTLQIRRLEKEVTTAPPCKGSRLFRAGLLVILAAPTVFTGCGSSSENRIGRIYELKRTPSEGSLGTIRSYLVDADRDVRATALFALTNARAPGAAEVALAGLKDPDPFVRATAVRCLSELEVPATVPFLIQRLSDDASWQVRQRAAEALGEIGGSEAVVALAHGADDPVALVRVAAVQGIAKLDPAVAVDALGRCATQDAEWEIRVLAAGALGRSSREDAFAPLEAAVRDPNEFVRAAAVRAQRELRAKIPQPPPGSPADPIMRDKQGPPTVVRN